MAKRPSRSFGDFAAQTARIADEGRQVAVKPRGPEPESPETAPETAPEPPAPVLPMPEAAAEVDPASAVEAVGLQADELVEAQGDEAVEPPAEEAAAPRPRAPAKPARRAKPAPKVSGEAKAEKRSTSLYLSGGAMRALRMIAASEGVRPHRVVDDALRAHFKRKGYDFDALNATD